MTRLATALSAALEAHAAAGNLATAIEASLGGPAAVAGAFVLSTAAAGATGEAVGERLAARWPAAELVGTSFEGLVFEGRVWQGEPAVAVLAWTAGPDAPQPVVCEGSERDPEALAREILAVRTAAGGADDVVVLFPDALGFPALEALLDRFEPGRGPWLAGAAAVGVDEGAAHAWVRPAEGGHGGELLVGLRFPGGARSREAESAADPASEGGTRPVRIVGATRLASPWLEITACRSHWIDALEGEPPVDWIRRQLGLADGARIEPHLDRLLVRLATADRDDADPDPAVFEERFLTGVDARRGSIGVLGRFARNDRLALALPDPGWAREALRAAVDALPPTPLLLQLGCPDRGESLHGDRDLESALVAHQSAGRPTLGVLAPFQLASDASGPGRLLVYSTVLVAVGPREEVGVERDSCSN